MKNVFELNVNDIVYRYNNNAVEAIKVNKIVVLYNSKSYAYFTVQIFGISAMTKESVYMSANACVGESLKRQFCEIYVSLDRTTGKINTPLMMPTFGLWLDYLVKNFSDAIKHPILYHHRMNLIDGFMLRRYYWKNNEVKSYNFTMVEIEFDLFAHTVKEKTRWYIGSEGIENKVLYKTEKECREANEIQIFDFPEDEEEKEFNVTIEQVSKFTKKVRAKNFERAQALVEENYYSGYYEDEILENQMAFFEQVN